MGRDDHQEGRLSGPLPPILRALRHRNYRLFFCGQIVSLIGTWMQSVAQSWLVYRLTGSSLLLGLVGFAGQFPVFLLSPIGGVVADRYNRHRIVIATQTASMLLAFVLAAATLRGRIQVFEVMSLAVLLGVVNAFDVPARQAFIVEMVPSDDMLNAIALNSSMVNSARVVGPAVAGVTVAAVGEGWCFLGNAVSYLAVIAGLLVPVGFSMMLQMAASNTLIQAMVPDHLRGRVLAFYAMMFMGMAPFLAQGMHAGEPPEQMTEQVTAAG